MQRQSRGMPRLSSAYFSLSPQDHVLWRNTFRCVLFFINKSSASSIKSPGRMTTKQTQHWDHCTIGLGELPSSRLSQHSQLTGLLPEQSQVHMEIFARQSENAELYTLSFINIFTYIALGGKGKAWTQKENSYG